MALVTAFSQWPQVMPRTVKVWVVVATPADESLNAKHVMNPANTGWTIDFRGVVFNSFDLHEHLTGKSRSTPPGR